MFQIQSQYRAPTLKIKRLSENAKLPTRATPLSIGLDIYSAADVTLDPHKQTLVNTDISILMVPGCYGRIAARSGLSKDFGIEVGAGVIDSDYTGNIGVIMYNHSSVEYKIKKGHRIAQLICEQAKMPEIEEVDSLQPTQRNNKGFSSSGK